MYLLHTNVISELRRPRPRHAVVRWVESQAADRLFLSAVTIGEIQAGIEITREQDAAKAEEIEAWLEKVLVSHSILPMDAAAFRAWARRKHRQSDTLIEDAMIAATAEVHGLTVVTRNAGDFRTLGVSVLDPFEPTLTTPAAPAESPPAPTEPA
ncbi:MAG: type II toxin-antitoxin system VapC family toxin [Spirochaetaceae bacterium]|nr:type II toxin-antitoxin system VapC family toxin [Spirochaetaceae bacterium]